MHFVMYWRSKIIKHPSKRAVGVLLFLLVFILAALLFRLNAAWGLPVRLHPDEGVIVNDALRLARTGSFEPRLLNRPDHLMIKLSALAYKFCAIVSGKSVSSWVGSTQIFVLVSRIIAGMFALGSVFLAWIIGRRYRELAGLVAASLFAMFPLYIEAAHYVTPEMPNVFCTLLFIYFALQYHRYPSIKFLFLMSVATVLFGMEKWPGFALSAAMAVSIIVCAIHEKSYIRIVKHGLLSLVFIVGVLFLLSPTLVLNIREIVKAVLPENAGHLGAVYLSAIGNALYYLKTYVQASGILLSIAFIYGCYVLIRNKALWQWLPLFSGAVIWLALSTLKLHVARWGLPMFVTPLLVSAIGLTQLYYWLRQTHISRKLAKTALLLFVVLSAVIAVNLAFGAAAISTKFQVNDSRVTSITYCVENDITTRNTLYEGYTPLNPTDVATIFDGFEFSNDNVLVTESRISYIIVSSSTYSRFYATPSLYADEVHFYNTLSANYEILKDIKPASMSYHPYDLTSIIDYYRFISAAFRDGVGPELKFYKVAAKDHVKYQYGENVSFAASSSTFDRYIVSGLSNANASGAWSDGMKTEFRFYVDSSVDKKITLRFAVSPLISASWPSQNVSISVNGEVVTQLNVTRSGQFDIPLPEGVDSSGQIDITFSYADATSPAAIIPGSSDTRMLALLFENLQLMSS